MVFPTIEAMQWLLHGTITAAAGEAMKRHEQKVHEMAELELAADAPAEAVLRAAAGKQWDILTGSGELARSPFELGMLFGRCIVLLSVPAGDVEQDDAVDRLFSRYKRLTPGRLYTVTESRVKIRQLPTRVGPPKIQSEI
jgi:hypothetical protein